MKIIHPDLELEILENGKKVEEFKKNTPGIYELELKAVNKKTNLKSEAMKIQVNVVLRKYNRASNYN